VSAAASESLDVTVVLATHNRARRLAALLETLRSQTMPDDRYEIVVVDDGSSDQTADVLDQALAEDGGPALRVIRRARAEGPAVARNEGWRAARAALIAFTDDDCAATPGWLEAGVHAARTHPGAIVQGRVEMNPDELDRYNPFAHTFSVDEPSISFETANVFYPRSLLEQLGGFDSASYPGPGGEDTDLGWRALETGAEAVFAPDAVIHHGVVSIGALKRLRVAARWTKTIGLYRRHPGLRKHLILGVFWRYNHYLLARFILALVLPRRWGALRLMLAAPYVTYLTDRRTGPLLAPYLLALDVVEVAAVLRGAVRYRTLVI
jgi:glycosyltransferase involved in cell wall biosynthesis